VFVLDGAKLLKPVDFALNSRAFAVEAQPFDCPYAFVHRCRRRRWLGGDFRHQLRVFRT